MLGETIAKFDPMKAAAEMFERLANEEAHGVAIIAMRDRKTGEVDVMWAHDVEGLPREQALEVALKAFIAIAKGIQEGFFPGEKLGWS